jgi:hypothetical protein
MLDSPGQILSEDGWPGHHGDVVTVADPPIGRLRRQVALANI